MKVLSLFVLLVLSINLQAKQSFTVLYHGDTKPITLEIPAIVNKDVVLEAKQKLIFNFDPETTRGLNAEIKIVQDGNRISFNGNSINRSLIEIKTAKIDQNNTNVYVKFIASEKILEPISNGIANAVIDNDILSFVTGNLENNNLYAIKLMITEKRIFKKEVILSESEVKKEDIVIEQVSSAKYKVSIDLNKLTNHKLDKNKRNTILLKLNSKYNFEQVINMEQIGPVNFEKEIVTNNQQ
jgi:hypothetical protein